MTEGCFAQKIIWVLIGNIVIGIGCAAFRIAGLGTDPFSCMNLGVSSHLPISYGTYQMLWNFAFFIPMLVWYRKGINIGSFINMIGVAYISDLFVWLGEQAGLTTQSIHGNIGMRLVVMLVGLVFYCFGVAFYVECEIGVAPYDALGQMIELWTRGKIPFAKARILMDVLSVVIGFALGSVVGIATLLNACTTGPCVTWIRKHIAGKLITHTAKKQRHVRNILLHND